MEKSHSCHDDLYAGDASALSKVTDPVCGVMVDPVTTQHHTRYEGSDHHFCSAKCRERFEARPEIFLEGPVREAAHGPEDVIYTCPMHPQIEQIGPGTCPILDDLASQ